FAAIFSIEDRWSRHSAARTACSASPSRGRPITRAATSPARSVKGTTSSTRAFARKRKPDTTTSGLSELEHRRYRSPPVVQFRLVERKVREPREIDHLERVEIADIAAYPDVRREKPDEPSADVPRDLIGILVRARTVDARPHEPDAAETV